LSIGQPLPERIRIDIDADLEDRIDAVLSNHTQLSRSRITALIEAGAVEVNGARVRKSYRPRAGDTILMAIPPLPPVELIPEDIPVEIVFEDEHLVVVDKPSGLVVHPAPGHPSGTLVNALLARPGSLSSVGLPNRPGIVHRLDRDTSGLLVVARQDKAHQILAAALSRREVGRGYVAATWGHIEPEEMTIDRPIARHPKDRKRMAVVDDGRPSITHVRRLERWPAADLLAIRLETGRTHQIRVHLKHIGHPVVGDPIYGPGWERGMSGAGGVWATVFARKAGRLFLHAARLSFKHPISGEQLSFTSALPEPLAAAVEWARGTA